MLLSLSIWIDLNDPGFDGEELAGFLIAEPMLSCWTNLFILFVFHHFQFFFLSWVCVWTDRVISLSLIFVLPTLNNSMYFYHKIW